MPWDELCSLERLMALHERGLREHRGLPGVRETGCPEATLGAAWHAVEYAEQEDTLPALVFAVYLLYYFATKQCFVDGNKRIAWAAMCEVLARYDLEIEATTDEAERFVREIATRQYKSVDPVLRWVMERLRELRS